MKKYFKLIAVSMCLTLILGLTACSGSDVAFIEDFDEEEELQKGYQDEDLEEESDESDEAEAADEEWEEAAAEEAVAVEEEGVYVFSDNVIFEKDGIKVTVDSYDVENQYINCTVDSTIDYREQFICYLDLISFNGFLAYNTSTGTIKVSGTETKEAQIYVGSLCNVANVYYKDMCETAGVDSIDLQTIVMSCRTYIEDNDKEDPHYQYYADPVYKEFSVKKPKDLFNKAFGNVAGKGSLSVDNAYYREDYIEYYGLDDIGQADLGFNVYAKVSDDGKLYVITEGTLADNIKIARYCSDFYDGDCKMPYQNIKVMPYIKAKLYIDDEEITTYNISLAEGCLSPFAFDIQDFRDDYNIPDSQKLAVKVEYIGCTATDINTTDVTTTVDLGEY